MKVSYLWLQEYFDDALPEPHALADLLTMHAFEVDGVERAGDDSILDLKILPDRAHDCYSQYGVAREIGAILNAHVKMPETAFGPSVGLETARTVSLSIADPAACRRAMKRLAAIPSLGETPDYILRRLEALGQRSINPVVDIANYVMFETGQPVHTFDYDKIAGGMKDISIRRARPGETLEALDDKEYVLDEETLVIADASSPLDIAGIKGGKASGIGAETGNILLSVCSFDPVLIRATRTRLGLRTDASDRFEKGIAPELASLAMERLSFLLAKHLGAEIAADILDEYLSPGNRPAISLSLSDVSAILGFEVDRSDVEGIFARLDCGFEASALGDYAVTPPPYRLDLAIKEDLVEEIGRLVGYENVPEVSAAGGEKAVPNKDMYYILRARQFLRSLGFSEVMTYSFGDAGAREVLNPIASDKAFLRPDLSTALRSALELNAKNAPLLGTDTVKIFEIGTVFTEEGEHVSLAFGIRFAEKKKQKEKDLLLETRLSFEEAFGPVFVTAEHGTVVEIDLTRTIEALSAPADDADLSLLREYPAVQYAPISPYPFITRDVALWVPEGVSSEEVREVLSGHAGELLAAPVRLFDTFAKEGRVSYAFRLVFQAPDRTLTDEEANAAMAKASEAAVARGWEIR